MKVFQKCVQTLSDIEKFYNSRELNKVEILYLFKLTLIPILRLKFVGLSL